MNSIHYALASIVYHKKHSYFLGIISVITIFILSTILNMINVERQINTQIKDWINFSDYYVNYNKTIYFFNLLYFIFFLLLIGLLFISLYHFSKKKEKELIKWRIMGFSDRFIMRQVILENMIPIFMGCLFISLTILVFQDSYTKFILGIKPVISEFIGIKNFSLFSSTTNESTINISLNNENTLFVSAQIRDLSNQTIMLSILKSCYLLLAGSFIINLLIAYYSILKSKKIFRR